MPILRTARSAASSIFLASLVVLVSVLSHPTAAATTASGSARARAAQRQARSTGCAGADA